MGEAKDLILCRGLPGSGKTSLAKILTMVGYRHIEADMFFEVDGIYQYDARRIQSAHEWCKRLTREALSRGESVVVSNTFTRLVEMAPYLQMSANTVRVIEAYGQWKNCHGVPQETVERMAARWEPLSPTGPASQSDSSNSGHYKREA